MDYVKENENFRVALVNDESGDKPYDEGAAPILCRYFHDYTGGFEAVNEQGKQYEDAVSEAYNRLNRDMDRVARYLRIFHGAYSIMEDSSTEAAYLAFDTTEWRNEHGLTDEYLETVKDRLDRAKLAEGSLSEIMAWTNGEVYGYVLEKRYMRNRVESLTDPVSGLVTRTSTEENVNVWESVEECYGYFGYDVAKEAAEEVFDAATKA